MNEYTFKIKTIADVKGLEDLKRSLTEGINQTKLMGGDTTALEARLHGVNAALAGESVAAARAATNLQAAIKQTKALKGDTSALEEQLRNITKQHGIQTPSLISKGAAVVGDALGEIPGVGAITRVLNGGKGLVGLGAMGAGGVFKSLAEFGQAQDVWAGVDAALAQTQQLTDANREAINNYAGELQKLTGISDETWAAVMGDIIQFGGSVDQVNQHADAVKNYAGLLKGNVAAASEGYRKALSGNFMAFTRLGFEMDKNASQTENLARLWEFLAQRGGGQLEARAKTLSGQWRILQNNVGDVFEAFGRGIAATGVVQNVLWALGKSAEWVASAAGGAVPKLEGLSNAQAKTITTAEDAAAAADGHAVAIDRVKDASDKATAALEKQQATAERLAAFEDKKADLEMARDLERLKARRDLPAAQKLVEEQRIRAAAEQRKAEIPIKLARGKYGDLEAALQEAQTTAQKAAAEESLQELRVGEARRVQQQMAGPRQRAMQAQEQIALDEKELASWDDAQKLFGVAGELPERTRLKESIAFWRRQLAEARAETSSISSPQFGDLGTVAEEEKKLAKARQATADTTKHATDLEGKVRSDQAGLRRDFPQLAELRDLTGQKSTEEALNKYRDQIGRGKEKLGAAQGKMEGKKPTGEDLASYNQALSDQVDNILAAVSGGLDPREAQGAFRDVLGMFSGSPEEKNRFSADITRRYFGALRQRRPIIPPPSVPAEPPAPPPGFDIRPPGYKPPTPPPPSYGPVEYDEQGVAMPPRNFAPEVKRAAAAATNAANKMGEATVDGFKAVEKRFQDQARSISTLAAQIAAGRTR